MDWHAYLSCVGLRLTVLGEDWPLLLGFSSGLSSAGIISCSWPDSSYWRVTGSWSSPADHWCQLAGSKHGGQSFVRTLLAFACFNNETGSLIEDSQSGKINCPILWKLDGLIFFLQHFFVSHASSRLCTSLSIAFFWCLICICLGPYALNSRRNK